MSSIQGSTSDYGAAADAANSAFAVPKFSGRIERLSKQFNEKYAEFNVISNNAKALRSEMDDITAMFDTITNRGLFRTALEASKECREKLEVHVVSEDCSVEFRC